MKKYTMFKQVGNIIPPHLVNKLAKEHGVDEKSRTFLPDGRSFVLGNDGTSDESESEVCEGKNTEGIFAPVSQGDLRG